MKKILLACAFGLGVLAFNGVVASMPSTEDLTSCIDACQNVIDSKCGKCSSHAKSCMIACSDFKNLDDEGKAERLADLKEAVTVCREACNACNCESCGSCECKGSDVCNTCKQACDRVLASIK